jgi:hypothetical protein
VDHLQIQLCPVASLTVLVELEELADDLVDLFLTEFVVAS